MKTETINKFDALNVVNLYSNNTIREIAKSINSDRRTITNYLTLKGVTIKGLQNNPKFDLEQILVLYKEGKSLEYISKIVNTKPETLTKYLMLNGITPINNYNVGLNKSGKKFNQHIFDSIDTEEKAYWLGFIFADGYISSKGFTFGIGLASKDKDHLEKFNSFMEFEGNNIKEKMSHEIYSQVHWTIRNVHLWKTLNSLGCVPRKSLILKFPEVSIFKKDILIKDFIRGYFEGDGCINTKYKIISVLGTESMLEGIKFYSNFITDAKLYFKKQNQPSTRILQTSHKKASFLLDYMYQNCTIYLDRKFELYKDFRPLKK